MLRWLVVPLVLLMACSGTQPAEPVEPAQPATPPAPVEAGKEAVAPSPALGADPFGGAPGQVHRRKFIKPGGTKPFTLTSTDFSEGQPIPALHTCEGSDTSPALAWANHPEGTRSFALIVDDPDAPDPAAPKLTWVHWVLYDIPATTDALAQGIAPEALPEGTRRGHSSWERAGYGGPCPPIGTHRYFHKLYALDTVLGDRGDLDADGLAEAMKGHVLAEARLMGTYVKTGE